MLSSDRTTGKASPVGVSSSGSSGTFGLSKGVGNCVCVCVCVCTFTRSCVWVWAHMRCDPHMEVRRLPHVLVLRVYLILTRAFLLFTVAETSCANRQAPGDFLFLSPISWVLQTHATVTILDVDSRNLNSGPHVCTASSPPTKPSSQTQTLWSYFGNCMEPKGLGQRTL